MDRRHLLQAAALSALALDAGAASPSRAAASPARPTNHVEAKDGTELFVRDWGSGPPVLFVAPWAFNSRGWQYQMVPLSQQGYRCIAFDRRGHGRSGDPGRGYDIDSLADDVASVVERLDLKGFTLVGHSLGAAECVRYLTRHGQRRVRALALIAPTTPFLAKTADNPDGVDPKASEAARAAFAKDFPAILDANIRPFVTPQTSQATINWIEAMMTETSLQAIIECNRAFAGADFRQELTRITVPTRIVQGDADVSAPLRLTGEKTAKLIPGARLSVIQGAPHGLTLTHTERVNAELLEVLRG